MESWGEKREPALRRGDTSSVLRRNADQHIGKTQKSSFKDMISCVVYCLTISDSVKDICISSSLVKCLCSSCGVSSKMRNEIPQFVCFVGVNLGALI